MTEAGADNSELTFLGLMDELDQARNPVMIIVDTAGTTGYQNGVIIIETPGKLIFRGKVNVETGSRIKGLQQVDKLLCIRYTQIVGPVDFGDGIQNSDSDGLVQFAFLQFAFLSIHVDSKSNDT